MNEVIQAANEIAGKSDRYIIVLLIVCFAVIAGLVVRWFISHHASLSRRLTEVTDRHIESQKELSQVVTNNTHALREVKDLMVMCRASDYRRSQSQSEHKP